MEKIFIFSEISWSFLDQRHHILARHFASQNFKVIFVERVVSRIPSAIELTRLFYTKVRSLFEKRKKERKAIPKNILLKRSFFLPSTNGLFNVWNFFYWKFCWEKKQSNCLVYSFVDNPFVFGNQADSESNGRIGCFDIIHNWWYLPWDTIVHKKNANRCLGIVSKVVTDSPLILSDIEKKLASKKMHLMLPAVGADWLNPEPYLWDDSSLDRKKFTVTFFGNLRHNSDLELINYFVESKNFNVHIFGLIDKSINLNVKQLKFHGAHSTATVSKFCHRSDIILLPYKDDKFSSSIAPAKYFESLATGALVISRAKLKHLPGWDKYIFIVNDLKINLNEIEKALANSKKRAEQIKFAKSHDWDSRMKLLQSYIFS